MIKNAERITKTKGNIQPPSNNISNHGDFRCGFIFFNKLCIHGLYINRQATKWATMCYICVIFNCDDSSHNGLSPRNAFFKITLIKNSHHRLNGTIAPAGNHHTRAIWSYSAIWIQEKSCWAIVLLWFSYHPVAIFMVVFFRKFAGGG